MARGELIRPRRIGDELALQLRLSLLDRDRRPRTPAPVESVTLPTIDP